MREKQTEVKESNAVIVREQLPVATGMPGDPEAILRYAIDHQADVSVIERMLVVRDKLKAEASKAAYDAAMADFQAECPIIKKERSGAKQAYKYAPLDSVVEQTRDLIRKHGFSFRVTGVIEPGWVKAQLTITHSAGHSELSEFKVPIDAKNPMMTDPQRYGGAMTFCKRYAFANGFGILTCDEDLDGGSKPKPPGPSSIAPPEAILKELARELWNALKSVRGDKPTWDVANQWMWREEVLDAAVPETAPHLTAEQFKRATARVKEILK